MQKSEIPPRNLVGVYYPRKASKWARKRFKEEVRRGLDDPIGSKSLCRLVSSSKDVMIVIPDSTRRSHTDVILPEIVRSIRRGGINDKNIKIVIGVGMHRKLTVPEIKKLIKKKSVLRKISIINHDPHKRSALKKVGRPSSKLPVILNKCVAESSFVITIGVVEPHLYAGLSGGAKTIAIGTAGKDVIDYTHHPRFIDKNSVKVGMVKGNDFHDFLWKVAGNVNFRFLVNVVNDYNGDVAGLFCGEPKKAYGKAAAFAKDIYTVWVKKKTDAVICGLSKEKGMNIYQASRIPTYISSSGRSIVKKGGLIVLDADLSEGAGKSKAEQRFFKMMSRRSPDEIIKLVRSRGCKVGEHRAYVVAKALKKTDIMFVGSKNRGVVQKMGFLWVKDMDEALDYIFDRYGSKARISVFPKSGLMLY